MTAGSITAIALRHVGSCGIRLTGGLCNDTTF